MYLKALGLNNFRSFGQAEIPLCKDLTILVGENNGGKSNAIDAMRLLTAPLGGRRELYCEATDIRFGSADRKFELTATFTELNPAQQGRMISAATDAAISGCVFGLKYDESTRRFPVRPVLWAGHQQGNPEPGCHEMIRHVYLPPLRDAKRALASGNPTRIYALLNHFLEGGDPEALAKTLRRGAEAEILEKVGGAVEVGLGALTAGVRRQAASLGFANDEKLIDIARDLRFKLSDHGIEPEDLRYSGHGYANLLYMATIAVELEKVNDADLTLFLVEEPEAHLHPQLQAAVLSFLDEQAEKSRKPRAGHQGPAGELQVIVATHSPNLSAWVESKKLVFFRSFLPAPAAAAPAPPQGEPHALAGIPAEIVPEIERNPVMPVGRPRRETRCIPLAALALDPVERRKVDRYLDVTKSAFLFGGRVLLVEGIAEALLLPVIAKKIVLKDNADKLRLFRSAVFVPIDGVDFQPYAKLLLSPFNEVRIADRLVVLTDGDGGEVAEGAMTPGAGRKRDLDPASDAELRASIAAHGLLQNLIVRPAAKGKFEVEAGERRRRAMLALADEKIFARDHEVTCLVLEDSAEAAFETSLAENFHRLAMNPADEAQAFAALIAGGATVEDVARRFGLTVRFVEGRLRLATLAPVVFEALASGEITLDIAKAFGATSDQEIQARVFEQVSSAYYAPNPDSIRRMVLSGTVRGSDPRARLVGRNAYFAAGGRIERELFDDDDSESWVDVALLESLAAAKMEEQAKILAAEKGLAWVKPTLDPYASHDLVEGLVRLPAEAAPLTEADLARLDELDASYDQHAAILEDEDSAEEAAAAAEAAIEAIERECQEIRARPPVLAPDLKAEAGMILVLSRDGTPVLQPVFYGERQADPADSDESIEVVPTDGSSTTRRTALSKRLVDELAMQRRDVLALHIASDPGLALDLIVFTLADADTHDWRARAATTLRGPAPSGPIIGFEAKDAPASSALAELRSGLDESWRAGDNMAARFDLFRALSDDNRAAWLGFVVARSLEASLNMTGERQVAFQDYLGSLVGIDMAQWWRPTAANYFDRVSKQVILDALTDVGGLELSSRFASVKKGDLAMSAERVFAGTYITEVEVREKALAWVPEVMRFAAAAQEPTAAELDGADIDSGEDDQDQSPRELAA